MVASPPDLLHMVGFLTGTLLYGMLLVMVARPPVRPDPFALATALLGLAWNVGEFGAYLVQGAGLLRAAPWITAGSFTALGFLSAVVVHSVARPRPDDPRLRRRLGHAIAIIVYAGAGIAGALHLAGVIAGLAPPSSAGLTWLTVGLVVAAAPLVAVTHQQANARRALWMAALAFFGVSALHLGRFHGGQESLAVEAIGHHASLLLVFAILYQDYRFALADLFLKQALTMLALVVVVFGGFAIVHPLLTATNGRLPSAAVAVLLTLWAATALVFPLIRRGVVGFVDRHVLKRGNYADFLSGLGEAVQRCDSPDAVLSQTSAALAEALSAAVVTWQERTLDSRTVLKQQEVAVWTAEAPHYVLRIGALASGRRLLSDDVAMLERVAVVLARRIDAVRLTGERYERMLQAREMRALATEAELRALRAQINPHFLFNALTTIAYLIDHAPRRAVETLRRLTTLLRSVLRSEGEFTTLGRERELVTSYLRIEGERFEERLTFEVDIPDALLALPIPSLILQPLVENAVKHGIADAVRGGTIGISARLDADLVIHVRNTGMPLQAHGSSDGCGVGLQNVERRLRHYYGEHAHVRLERGRDGATVAELRLPVARVEDEGAPPLAEAAAR